MVDRVAGQLAPGLSSLASHVAPDIALLPATPRLRFRRVCEDHRDAVARLLTDADVMVHYKPFATPQAGAHWMRALANMERDHGFAPWTVELHDGTFVGQFGPFAQLIDGRAEIELICFFLRPFWRSGYAAEAARAYLRYAFARDPVLKRVVELIYPQNRPARRLAFRCGFVYERTLIHDGNTMDLFTISREQTYGEAEA